MRKLALFAALAALAIAVPLSFGSSHREAPLTSIDPTGDDTDTYAFTAQDAPGALTIVGNWVPFEDPAGGPNFYKFDDNAHYYLNIDNTGDGVADVRYLFDFKTKTRNPNSFLYTNGQPVDSVNSPNRNVVQTYSVTRDRPRVTPRSSRKNLPTPPSNVGPKTIPNYEQVQAGAIRGLPGGGKVFAGQREDPFYAALGRIFDTVNLTGAGLGNQGGGVDDLAGYAVQSIVLQVPESRCHPGRQVRSSSARPPNAVVGVWASTERQSISVKGHGHGSVQPDLATRQPAGQRGDHPAGPEGPVQPDAARRTTRPTTASTCSAGAGGGAEQALPGTGQRSREEPHRHRPGGAAGHPGSQCVPRRGRKERDRHAQDQPGYSADRRRRTALACSAGTTRVTRTGGGSPTTWSTSTSRSSPAPCRATRSRSETASTRTTSTFLSQFPYVAPPKPGANPDAGYGSQLKAIDNGNGTSTPPSFSATGGSGGGGGGGGGPDAIVWVLIGAGVLALAGLGRRVARGGKGKGVATT